METRFGQSSLTPRSPPSVTKSKARPRQSLSRAFIKALKDQKGLLGKTLSPVIEAAGNWKIPIE